MATQNEQRDQKQDLEAEKSECWINGYQYHNEYSDKEKASSKILKFS